MSGVNHITTIDGIPVYSDPHMDRTQFIVTYKSAELFNPGYVFVPTDVWNEGMKTAVGAPIEKDEVDRILKMKRDRKLSDVKGIICNCPKEDIDKIIQSLYKNFK